MPVPDRLVWTGHHEAVRPGWTPRARGRSRTHRGLASRCRPSRSGSLTARRRRAGPAPPLDTATRGTTCGRTRGAWNHDPRVGGSSPSSGMRICANSRILEVGGARGMCSAAPTYCAGRACPAWLRDDSYCACASNRQRPAVRLQAYGAAARKGGRSCPMRPAANRARLAAGWFLGSPPTCRLDLRPAAKRPASGRVCFRRPGAARSPGAPESTGSRPSPRPRAGPGRLRPRARRLAARARVSGPSTCYSTRCIVRSLMTHSGVPLNFSNIAWRAPHSVRKRSWIVPEDLRSVLGARCCGPAAPARSCGPMLRVVEVGLRRVDHDAAAAEVDEDARSSWDVLEVVGAPEVDEDVVRLVQAAGGREPVSSAAIMNARQVSRNRIEIGELRLRRPGACSCRGLGEQQRRGRPSSRVGRTWRICVSMCTQSNWRCG